MATAKTYLRDGVRYDRKTDKPFVAGVSPSEPASAGGPISTATLSGQADIKLPNPSAPTAAAGLEGAVKANADQFTKDLEQRRKDAEAAKNDSMGSLMEALRDQEGAISRTSREYAREGGVDQLEVELKDINQQILQESEALRRSVERIQTAPGTATSAERDRQIRETERVSLRKQADLSIIQLARRGSYDSAKAIADRKVAAALEQDKIELDNLKFVYSENKDLFDKAESRQFETIVRDREREFDRKEKELQAISDLALDALQNGAPVSVVQRIQNATTRSDAYAAGGSYIGRLDRMLKSAQLAKLNKDMQGTPTGTPSATLINPETGRPDPVGSLSSFIKNAEAKDNANLQNIGGVLAAVQGFASQNPSGTFAGTGPIAQFNPFKGANATANAGSLGAINLKVQQWASGATLTEAQTKQVNQLVPKAGDLDTTIKNKTNALANFMLDQARGTLSSQGLNYDPGRVDFFDNQGAVESFLDDVDTVLNSTETLYSSAGYNLD